MAQSSEQAPFTSEIVGSILATDSCDYLIPSVLAAFLLATRRCVQSRTHLLTYV